MKRLFLILVVLVAFSCSSDKKSAEGTNPKISSQGSSTTGQAKSNDYSETKNAYFGNLHIHTSWSFDGFTNGSVTQPDDAYRWARGEAIPGGGGGGDLQIKVPLDWYAVSDHAEWMGMFNMMADTTTALGKLDFAKRVTSDDQAVAFQAFADFLDVKPFQQERTYSSLVWYSPN